MSIEISGSTVPPRRLFLGYDSLSLDYRLSIAINSAPRNVTLFTGQEAKSYSTFNVPGIPPSRCPGTAQQYLNVPDSVGVNSAVAELPRSCAFIASSSSVKACVPEFWKVISAGSPSAGIRLFGLKNRFPDFVLISFTDGAVSSSPLGGTTTPSEAAYSR